VIKFCVMNSVQEIWRKVFKRHDDIVSREIAGESILVPVCGKLADMQKIFSLESTAEYIWQQMDGKTRLADICRGVIDTFDVEKERAESDITEFINELLEANLIVEVK
jgi:hypothetical protein